MHTRSAVAADSQSSLPVDVEVHLFGPLGTLCAMTRSVNDQLAKRLEARVRHLAEDIGERHFQRPLALSRARQYIHHELTTLGVHVTELPFSVQGMEFHNIEVVAPARSPSNTAPQIVVGAHYDTVPGTPGADDNASAVAALIELIAALGHDRFERSVRFVFFPNEEPPFFPDAGMGSDAYARNLRQRGVNVSVMISLEMLGYYSTEPGSQRYPPGLGLLYPDRGDFIGFVSNLTSRSRMHDVKRVFKANSDFPCESLAAPEWTVIVGLSDHRSFWGQNYPALMVTDTAFMRNPNYHQPTDTPDTLDYARFGEVTRGLIGTVRALAEGA